MRLRMDELGRAQVGKVIAWEVPSEGRRGWPMGDEGFIRGVTTCKLLHASKMRQRHVEAADSHPQGVMCLTVERSRLGRKWRYTYYVAADWTVDVEDAA